MQTKEKLLLERRLSDFNFGQDNKKILELMEEYRSQGKTEVRDWDEIENKYFDEIGGMGHLIVFDWLKKNCILLK